MNISNTEWGFMKGTDNMEMDAVQVINEKEYPMHQRGYYFEIAGKYRQYEAVSFYIALSKAGFPVIIDDAQELLARFEAKDYIGVVPHDVPTRYCESRFPQEYGVIIDFYHVYEDEDPWIEKIIWLQEEPARLIDGVMEWTRKKDR